MSIPLSVPVYRKGILQEEKEDITIPPYKRRLSRVWFFMQQPPNYQNPTSESLLILIKSDSSLFIAQTVARHTV